MQKDRRESLREARAEYREWEDSLEGVAYWLGDLPVSESLERAIVNAVRRLPNEARDFVYHNCRFASADAGGVGVRHSPQGRQPCLIALGEGDVDEDLIIHEIAHAWLGHGHDLQVGGLRIAQRDDEAACDLTKQWRVAATGTERANRPH